MRGALSEQWIFLSDQWIPKPYDVRDNRTAAAVILLRDYKPLLQVAATLAVVVAAVAVESFKKSVVCVSRTKQECGTRTCRGQAVSARSCEVWLWPNLWVTWLCTRVHIAVMELCALSCQ